MWRRSPNNIYLFLWRAILSVEDLPRALFPTHTYGFVSFNYSSSRVWTREDLLETILSSLRAEDCG